MLREETSMMIVPALLSENYDDFLVKLRTAEKFSDYVQIDLMDGVFVRTKSFSPELVNTLSTTLAFELHLMVQDPAGLIQRIGNPNLKQVIFHCEFEGNQREVIRIIRDKGLAVGVALKPETELARVYDSLSEIDTVLFLTVDPCCYGNPFKPEVLEKVAAARQIMPGKRIAADGGVSLDNLRAFRDAGADYVCVGSRIFLDGKPEENFRAFVEKVEQIEKKNT